MPDSISHLASGSKSLQHGLQDRLAAERLRALELTIGRKLISDFDAPRPGPDDFRDTQKVAAKVRELGPEIEVPIGTVVRPRPSWFAIALFFNLPAARHPSDYNPTTSQQALDWLDQGANPAIPPIGEFMQDYWRAVSYGRFNFSIETPRDSTRHPLIFDVDADPQDHGAIARQCLDRNAEAIWRAAGSRLREGRRWIPSLIVVQHYWSHASAGFGGWQQSVGGLDYEVGDLTHVPYNLEFATVAGSPTTGRQFWPTLVHEHAHNFLEFGDLYGPQGCTGYWDVLGDHLAPTRMSEISSMFKKRVGWIEWKGEIFGPDFASADLDLLPYSSSGEAYKVIPDPEHTPFEYFLLEYRKSLGRENWRPDGGLSEQGLLITHVNERLGIPSTWMVREAPLFDPEFADYSDKGAALWTGFDRLAGVLYPQPGNDRFTDESAPDSDLYGFRRSGLRITNIRIQGGRCRFRLEIRGNPQVGWRVGPDDRAIVGRFTPNAAAQGDELFIHNANEACLVVEEQAQFLVRAYHNDWIGDWNLGAADRAKAADLDGDGLDELFLRSAGYAGVLKWTGNAFRLATIQEGRVGDWILSGEDREIAVDLNGDGRSDLFMRCADRACLLRLNAGAFLNSPTLRELDGRRFGTNESELVGRFTRTDREEILIKSAAGLALLGWSDSRQQITLLSTQGRDIGPYRTSADHLLIPVDLDGDGLDEIFVQVGTRIHVLKWRDGAFRQLLVKDNQVEHFSLTEPEHRLQLMAGDRAYGGRFFPSRGGILHRGPSRLALIGLESDGLKVRHYLQSPLDWMWNLGPNDKFVVGRFQRVGPDVSELGIDLVSDVTESVFIHNGWGTGVVGVNFPPMVSPPTSQMGITWMAAEKLMIGGPPRVRVRIKRPPVPPPHVPPRPKPPNF